MIKKFFDDFYKLEINEQGSLLIGLMQILPVHRRRHGDYDDPNESRRQSTISFIPLDDEGILKKFRIHVKDTVNAIMCVWHEGQSGRRGSQIASCLIQAINSGHLTSYKRNLTDWGDNCAGQLKTSMLLFLYIWFIANGTFNTIEHKFFTSGHSYPASDRDCHH